MPYTQSVRDTPRISLNKLGEYMTASPSRRRSIVRDQKRPKDAIVARYTDAQDAIVQYLSASVRNVSILHDAREKLGSGQGKTEWDEQRRTSCSEALQCFIDIAETLELEGLELTPGANEQSRLKVAGVEISVRPEVIVRGDGKKGRFVGAIKLCIGKTNELDQKTAEYITTVLHQYVAEQVEGEGETTDYRQCRVLDVFASRLYEAPLAFKARRKDIEAACQEIALLWEVV